MNAPRLVSFFSKPLLAMPACAAVAAAAFSLAVGLIPPRVHVSLAFTIAQQARQETTEYSYDGYYALRASELVADTLLSWLATPSIVKEIYAAAGIPLTDEEIAGISGRMFRGKKFSSQNVVVSYSVTDAVTAAKLHQALALALANRARSLVLSPRQESLFLATALEPVVSQAGIPRGRAALAGAFVGAFVGLAFAYAAQRKRPL